MLSFKGLNSEVKRITGFENQARFGQQTARIFKLCWHQDEQIAIPEIDDSSGRLKLYACEVQEVSVDFTSQTLMAIRALLGIGIAFPGSLFIAKEFLAEPGI
jgi:hypothetical protein